MRCPATIRRRSSIASNCGRRGPISRRRSPSWKNCRRPSAPRPMTGSTAPRPNTRRGVRGYLAMSKGLVAIGAGDVAAARKFAEEADRIAPGEPLVLLLNAQTAQLAGDRAAAERAFETMAGRADTKLLGLHGLYV